MDKLKRHILLPFLVAFGLLVPATLSADEQDFATDYGVAAKVGITKRFDAEFGGGARLRNNSSELDRISAEGGFGYAVIKKWLDFEAGYCFFADWNGGSKQYYTYRHRYSLGFDLKHKVYSRLEMDLRVKWQSTYQSTKYKTYAQNPKDLLRIKAGAEQKIKGIYLFPYVSAEAFVTTNSINGNDLVDMRYRVGAKYQLNMHNAFDLGFQIDDEMNVGNPEDRCMLCIGYKYKF